LYVPGEKVNVFFNNTFFLENNEKSEGAFAFATSLQTATLRKTDVPNQGFQIFLGT
jgi:hypothetical protein